MTYFATQQRRREIRGGRGACDGSGGDESAEREKENMKRRLK